MLVAPLSRSSAARAGRQPRRGAAAVEFACVAALLFLLIFGIIEFGRAMMVLELLGNAARSGARVGVLNGSDNAAVTAAVTSALTGSNVTGTTTTIQVNGVTKNVNTAVMGDAVTVVVSVPYANVSWLPSSLVLGDKSLTGRMVMRRE